MPAFKRLTWNDLETLTRAELMPRLEAEQNYWARKERRGMSEADEQARKEFRKIFVAVINPAAFATALDETNAWLQGERPHPTSYWDSRPGDDTTPGGTE